MDEPIMTEEQAIARLAVVQQRLTQADHPLAVEQSLEDMKAILTFWRRFQEAVERQRHDYPLDDYRALRRYLRRQRHAAKATRYQLLMMQAVHLHVMHMGLEPRQAGDG